MLKDGQGLLVKINYADGGICEYDRTFLILDVSDTEVRLLNVSSLSGKVHKLAFPSNFRILDYKPPFAKDSFVKLDALYIVENNDFLEKYLLASGRVIRPTQLKNITNEFNNFKKDGNVAIVEYSINDIADFNDEILPKDKEDCKEMISLEYKNSYN